MLQQGKNNEVHWQSEVLHTMPIKTLSVTICSSSPKPHHPNCFPSRHPSSPACCRRNRSRVLPPSSLCCHSFLCPKIQLSSRPFLVSLPCLVIFPVTSPPTSHHRLPSLYPSRQSLSYPNPWNRVTLYGLGLKVNITQTPKWKSMCLPPVSPSVLSEASEVVILTSWTIIPAGRPVREILVASTEVR